MAASEARLVVVQNVVLCKKQRELVEHNSLKCLCEEGIPVCSFLKVLDLERFFKQWAYPSLLKCCGKCTSVKRGVDNVSKRRYD